MSMSKTACITSFMIVIQIQMFHIDVHIDVYASHTQYNVRTDVRFLWTLCSCPQVDREVILIQTHRSQQLI